MSYDIRITQENGLESYVPDRLRPLMLYLAIRYADGYCERVLRW